VDGVWYFTSSTNIPGLVTGATLKVTIALDGALANVLPTTPDYAGNSGNTDTHDSDAVAMTMNGTNVAAICFTAPTEIGCNDFTLDFGLYDGGPPQVVCSGAGITDLGCIYNTAIIPLLITTPEVEILSCGVYDTTFELTEVLSGCTYTVCQIITVSNVCPADPDDAIAVCTQKFTYSMDLEQPKIWCPPGRDLGCIPDDKTPEEFMAAYAPLPLDLAAVAAAATDNCTCELSVDLWCDTYTTNGCLITLDRKIRVTDCCGNLSMCSIVYTTGTEAPVIASVEMGSNVLCQTDDYWPGTNLAAFALSSTQRVLCATYMEDAEGEFTGTVGCAAAVYCPGRLDCYDGNGGVGLNITGSTFNATPIMMLDFQGVGGGLGGTSLTEPGFTPINFTQITAVPAPVVDVNPVFPIGPYTLSFQGNVGGFGRSNAGPDEMIRDYMFLGTVLGYDDSVGYTIGGLMPNTPYQLTWTSGDTGNANRAALITTQCDSGTLANTQPDLVLSGVSDCNGDLTGTMTRNGSSVEANIAGLTVREGTDRFLAPKGTYATALASSCAGSAFVGWESLFIQQTSAPGGDIIVTVSNSTDTVLYGTATNQTVIPLTGATDPILNIYITLCSTQTDPCLSPIVEKIHGVFECESLFAVTNDPGFSVTNVVTTNGCDVTIARTYRFETCCDLADEETVTFTYTKLPDLDTGPLAKLDLGCIATVAQIPPVDLTMFAATSSCEVVSIQKLGQTDPVLAANGCTWSNERVFVVETLCGVTNLVTQSVCWVINDSRPEILATAKDGEHYGCATNVPRTAAESFAALEIVNATQTQLISEVFMNQGCDVMVVRTWRVEDCCGNFDRRIETFMYTPASELLADATINPTVDVGCVTSLNLIPKDPWLTMQSSGNIFCYSPPPSASPLITSTATAIA